VNSRNAAVVLCALTLVAACSDDDGGGQQTLPPGPTTTPATAPPSATPLPTGTSPPTSDPPTTTEPPTTVAPTTTISQEAEEARIKRQVARAYVTGFNHEVGLGQDPPSEGLVRQVHRFAVPGSPISAELVSLLRRLVDKGTRMVVSDPSLNTTTVESVELIGPAPYNQALVTHCTVLIQEEARVARSGDIVIIDRAGLRSFRGQTEMRFHDGRWKEYELRQDLLDAWPGENRCTES
jgi:hypothetical protein